MCVFVLNTGHVLCIFMLGRVYVFLIIVVYITHVFTLSLRTHKHIQPHTKNKQVMPPAGAGAHAVAGGTQWVEGGITLASLGDEVRMSAWGVCMCVYVFVCMC